MPEPRLRPVARVAGGPLGGRRTPRGIGSPVAQLLVQAAIAGAAAAGVGGGWLAFRPRPQPAIAAGAADTPHPPVVASPQPSASTPVAGAAVPAAPAGPAALSGEQVYQRLLTVSALILAGDGIGSGVVVDADHRLVLTNAHVMSGETTATVVFPAFAAGGAVLTEADRYPDLVRKTGSPARVAARKPLADLALLELDRLPAGVRAVPVSGGFAPTGSKVFSVGNSAAVRKGQLWRFTAGNVRGRGRQEYRDEDGRRAAVFLETDAPTNPGDSGGPVVDDRGRLVAVVASGDPRSRAVSQNVDVAEVREFLAAAVPTAGWVWADGAAAAAAADELPPLVAALGGPVEGRAAAARKIAALGAVGKRAVPDLLRAMAVADPDTAATLVAAVQALGPPTAADAPAVARLLTSTVPAVRLYAADLIASQPGSHEAGLLVRLLGDDLPAVRLKAVKAVGQAGPGDRRRSLAALVARLSEPDPGVASAAAELLTSAAWVSAYDPADVDALRPGLRAGDPRIRAAVADLLGPLYPDAPAAVADLAPLCGDRAAGVRRAAVAGLGRWGAAAVAAGPAVGRLVDDPDPGVRRAALPLLSAVLPPGEVCRTIGRRYLAEPDQAVRTQLGRTLAGLDLSTADRAVVERMAGDADPVALRLLARQLGRRPDGAGIAGGLVGRAELPDDVRTAAVEVLGEVGPPAASHAAALVGYIREQKTPRRRSNWRSPGRCPVWGPVA